MASAAGPIVHWCHQCNAQTRPAYGDDVVCTFCNEGFIEELENTEFEPGVAFSTLPLAFGNLLRMPSPGSVGISRSTTNIPSSPQQAASNSSSSPSLWTSSSAAQHQIQRTSSGLQGHRPRILSGQLSGVPSLLEAMMQAIEDMNGSASENQMASDGRSVHASTHVSRQGPLDPSEDFSSRGDSHPQTPSGSGEGEHTFLLPVPPMLIVHGDMPNGSRTVEIFVDNGQGMGPQMMPNQFRDYFLGPDLDRLIQMLSENDPNRYGTPPAAKSAVEKLPKFTVSEEHLGSGFAQCAVCKDDFELGAEVQEMPCKHIYHPNCILPWLAQHNSCPVCRFELPTEDADYEARKGQSRSSHTNVIPTEGQRTPMQSSSNPLDGREPRGQDVANVDEEQNPRPFTLWGIPSILGLSPLIRMESQSDSVEMRQGQDASSEDGNQEGAAVQWLFCLFSSESVSEQDNAANGDQNLGSGSGRNFSNI